MEGKKRISWACLGLFAGVCLCSSNLSAWQRTAMEECKQEERECKSDADQCTSSRETCKKQAEQCRKDAEQCRKDAPDADESSFTDELSSYAYSLYVNFTPKQKKKAMDYADKNKMSPDDAVVKVARQP